MPEPSRPPPSAAYRTLANGRYILVRKLAEGGTASVHLGYDTVDHQWRAIKTLLPDYAKRPALRHRFEREAATMRDLRHPNLIRVFDAGSDDETAYLVMEFAEAGSVIDWVEKHGPMPPRMGAEVGLSLCAGIQVAHEEGIIHRDIKPQNLLVDRDGVCKVTDFGIAQVVQETRMTMTGTVMGTIGYMAPEQHESAKHADERADVYSIAATLYTLIRGEAATHLFMADDRDFERIPGGIAAVIKKAAQYRREARYGTVAELAKALRAATDELPPDPIDVPPLVPPDVRLLDDVTPPTFSQVRVRAPTDPTDSSIEPQPGSLDASNEADIVPVPPPPSEGTPSSVRPRTQSESGLHRAIKYVPVREFQERQDRLRRVVRWTIGTAVAMLGVLAVILTWEGAQLRRLERQHEVATQELVDQVHQERVLLDALKAIGADTEPLEKLFLQVARETDASARDAAASRLSAQLEDIQRDLRRRNLSSEQHAVKQLAESLRRLDEKRRDYEQTRDGLDDRLDRWSGQLWTFIWGG